MSDPMVNTFLGGVQRSSRPTTWPPWIRHQRRSRDGRHDTQDVEARRTYITVLAQSLIGLCRESGADVAQDEGRAFALRAVLRSSAFKRRTVVAVAARPRRQGPGVRPRAAERKRLRHRLLHTSARLVQVQSHRWLTIRSRWPAVRGRSAVRAPMLVETPHATATPLCLRVSR
jgi:hypothetical protein